jgi:XRE family aerobic/anaerobic benzoate catabolism transcriptional regulator
MKPASAPIGEAGFADVGLRLRAARAKIGITRKQLAAVSDTSERYLAQIEAGAGNPSLSVLTALARALDMSVADLLPLGGERSALYERAAAAVRNLPEHRLPTLMNWLMRPSTTAGEKGHRLVLVGLRGAGKSSLGRALAARLDLPFVEISKQVEEAYGADIGLLIELGGQPTLRRYEAEAWSAIRNGYDAAVIAAPGGIVANGPLYDQVLATAHTIWLQASPEDHMGRVMAQGDFRPMADNRGAMTDLKAILDARSADYARADARLDTSTQDFDATLDLLEGRTRELISI